MSSQTNLFIKLTGIKWVILFYLMFPLSLHAQLIKGKVFQLGTDSVISHASIYLEGTLIGTTTDSEGMFALPITEENKMPVIVSAIGYYSASFTDYSSDQFIKVYLQAKTYQLEEVVVQARGIPRAKKLKLFIEEFIGTSPNAKHCTIKNADDIELQYNLTSKTLTAYCDKPILIENKALGYQITYYLDSFIKTDEMLSFQGYYFFREDTLRNKAAQRKAKKKRSAAYLGSRMHLIRSLWGNNAEKEGFRIYGNNYQKLTAAHIVAQNQDQKHLFIKDYIKVEYTKKQKHTSYLYQKQDSTYIDKNGYFDTKGIRWSGYMAQQRIADLLPFDF